MLHTLCGIPAITLEGTTEDWEALAERAEAFAEFGLEAWIDLLRPILRQFVRASKGDVDPAFWRSLYKYEDQSGGPVITGWILGFFPYLKDRRTGLASVPVQGMFESGDEEIESMLHPDEGSLGTHPRPRHRLLTGRAVERPFAGSTSTSPSRWNSWAASWAWPRTRRRSPCGPRSVGGAGGGGILLIDSESPAAAHPIAVGRCATSS